MTNTATMPLPRGLDVLTALMNSTADLAQDFMARFWKEHQRGELDLAGRLYDEYARNAEALDRVLAAILVDPGTKVGDRVRDVNGSLIVAMQNRDDFGVTTVLTEDGLGYAGGWHEGLISDEDQVRVVRYENDRCVFHGYIDSVSRRLTQTG